MGHLCKDRHIDQQNQTECLEIVPHISDLFLSCVPKQFKGKRLVVSTNGARAVGYSHAQG